LALYATAAALLAAGVFWWVRAAPPGPQHSKVDQWKASALRLLPDVELQDSADTMVLAAGVDQEVVSDVGSGEFVVSVVCVGGEQSRVRVSLGDIGTDSGHGLDCTDDEPPDVFEVALADRLRMNVTVDDAGPVVLRYRLLRATE
jgi:hypothetical protein